MGALGVSLSLNPKRALLSDTNPHLVNFFRHVQEGLDVNLEMQSGKDAYYPMRDRFNELIQSGQADSAEAAQFFYYLNRTCFNGLCRFNKKGLFNVPCNEKGPGEIRYNTTEDFAPYKEALKNWEFMGPADFEEVPLRADDVVYADPPYDDGFTDYSPGGFSWADQERLAQWLANAPGPVVASNHATDRVLDLYREHGFVIHGVPSKRRINSKASGRGDRMEMLAVNGLACNDAVPTDGACGACGIPLLN